MEHIILTLAAIGILALVCQWFAWWVKLPAILFLLVAGILIGPVAGWLRPDELFGDLFMPFVSLSVAVILFEGSLSLRFEEIRGVQRVVRVLVTSGVIITWIVITLGTKWILGVPWQLAFLFGALVVVTGPTVIVPMLRSVRPNARVANILRWEGILIDPIGALLAVLVFEFIISGQAAAAFGHVLLAFGSTLTIGLVLGVAAGYLLGLLLRNHWIPEFLHNVAALTIVFAVYALSNLLQEESGLLTVTVMGVWMANMKKVPVDEILDFKESLSVLLISGLFILLAARLDISELQIIGWGAIAVFLWIQFIARPVKVVVATFGSELSWQERTLLAWIAPRGIVAAAISALFALRLEAGGYEQASFLVPLTFTVIIGTVVLQSATARPLAGLLGVSEPERKGYLIIGSNPFSRKIGKALLQAGHDCIVVDGSWTGIQRAKMAGLRTYYGNAVSEHADRHLDLVGIGNLLAISSQAELNALAALRYKTEFGADAVYYLHVDPETQDETRQAPAPIGHVLFAKDVSYARLAGMLGEGATLRATKLSDASGWEEYQSQNRDNAVPLFMTDPKGALRWFVEGKDLAPDVDCTVYALVLQDEEAEPNKEMPS